MSNNLEFVQEKDSLLARVPTSEKKNSPIVKWVLNSGLAKNEKTANVILIVIAALILIISGLILAYVFSGSPKKIPIERLPNQIKKVLAPNTLRNLERLNK